MSPTIQPIPAPHGATVQDHMPQIAAWIQTHQLNEDEASRLRSVLADYPPGEVAKELKEELRCVLAARELANRPALTPGAVDRARAAFESGRVPFISQDVD